LANHRFPSRVLRWRSSYFHQFDGAACGHDFSRGKRRVSR
jgi:hypothetical protein